MRKILQITVAAFLLAAPMGGCALFQKGGEVATTTMVTADKVLNSAHVAWEGASYTLQVLANSGVLKGQTAITAQKYYDDATAYLKKADAAHDIANAVLENSMAQAALGAIALATTQHGE